MKFRFSDQLKARGIALVITLVMLAVVTVMAIVFLAVTRRERASVIVTEETAIAKDMADAALERAKSEAMAKMNATGTRLNYDMFNSQAFYNPNGFRPVDGATNINVAPVWDWPQIRANNEENYLQMLANLQYNPAVPVFVETNRNGRGDFRYYLDFNRNRQFETNGLLYDYDANYRPIVQQVNGQNVTNRHRFVGDPEWIGVLERPDYPHSETNRFIGRLAYLVLPAGKTLDLNFLHNHVNGPDRFDGPTVQNGFSRSQGVGPWEINLAAFFRELNGNNYAWPSNSYRLTLNNGMLEPQGFAFDDARSLLAFRLSDTNGISRRSNLESLFNTLGRDNLLNQNLNTGEFRDRFERNYVEEFARRPFLGVNGNVFFPPAQVSSDDPREDVNTPGWPGSINTNAFTDIQQLFSLDTASQQLINRLQIPGLLQGDGGNVNSGKSSYDRYTFYRLASQLGTDSSPATEGKIHLNFKNPVGFITNQTELWIDHPTNAVYFFTNAADLMLKASIDGTITISNDQQVAAYRRPYGTYHIIGDTLVRTNFGITNIQVYGITNHYLLRGQVINEYTPTVHRILQVAANIYDSMTNREALLPTVFMPVFQRTPSNIVISTYIEVGGSTVTNSAQAMLNRPWTDPETAFTNSSGLLSQYNLFGQHMVIGAKKGHPNFNELALNSRVEFSRKLSFRKTSAASTNIAATNQMFLLGLEQRWGMEAWNSYLRTNDRPMTVAGEVRSTVALRDSTNLLQSPVFFSTNVIISSNMTIDPWGPRARLPNQAERHMLTLIDRTQTHINERSYTTGNGTIFGTNRLRGVTDADYSSTLELPPEFVLYTTNKVRYWILDNRTGRLVDFVSFDRLVTEMDLRERLRENQNLATGTNQNRISYWDTNRINAGSAMTVGISNQIAVSVGELAEPIWRPYRYNSPDKVGSISKFRAWLGLPLRTGIDTNLQPHEVPQGIQMQVPFTPTRQMVQRMSWQVNDPLVHYMFEDLRRDRVNEGPQIFDNVDDRVVNRTNQWNIGLRNKRYHPWSGADDVKQDPFSWNVGLMDPGVRSSDDWDFMPRYAPSNYFPNIGALGQIHRGTPWQTIYLKSFYRQNPQNGDIEIFADPSVWYEWAGSIGTHPTRDWRLMDVFTTALNENAARGLLSVNQTNTAAWSAVLSGTVVATNRVNFNTALQNQNRGVDPVTAYVPLTIEPGSPQIAEIVRSIIHARTNQFDIVRNPDPNANKNQPYIPIWRTNTLSGRRADVFRTMGEIVSAPALSVQSPYLNREQVQVRGVWTDRAVEYIPQQIMSLLQRDEPRFVVYAFGQSLKPAPRSLTTDPDFYHLCTNYQITGEVITKTTFRVEGQPQNPNNPLRPVIEKYEFLPPLE